MIPVVLAGLLSVSGLVIAVLTVRLRRERREKWQAVRAAERADRTLTAFVDESAEDFLRGPNGEQR
jgi:hypothetical protein